MACNVRYFWYLEWSQSVHVMDGWYGNREFKWFIFVCKVNKSRAPYSWCNFYLHSLLNMNCANWLLLCHHLTHALTVWQLQVSKGRDAARHFFQQSTSTVFIFCQFFQLSAFWLATYFQMPISLLLPSISKNFLRQYGRKRLSNIFTSILCSVISVPCSYTLTFFLCRRYFDLVRFDLLKKRKCL